MKKTWFDEQLEEYAKRNYIKEKKVYSYLYNKYYDITTGSGYSAYEVGLAINEDEEGIVDCDYTNDGRVDEFHKAPTLFKDEVDAINYMKLVYQANIVDSNEKLNEYELRSYSVGDIVYSPRHGYGKVTDVDLDRAYPLKVKFDNGDIDVMQLNGFDFYADYAPVIFKSVIDAMNYMMLKEKADATD